MVYVGPDGDYIDVPDGAMAPPGYVRVGYVVPPVHVIGDSPAGSFWWLWLVLAGALAVWGEK